MADINWSAESRRDLKTIADYFDTSSPEYSKYIIDSIFESVMDLENFPEIGRTVPELEEEVFRELIVDGYRIIYILIDEKTIEILTIIHSRQDLMKHLQRIE